MQLTLPTAAPQPARRGRRLSPATARAASAALGTPLHDVRVHEDGSAEALGFEAYAHGSNVYFARGAYRPASDHGARVLGHELAHVAQQRSGRVPATGSLLGVPVNADAGLESSADDHGRIVARALRGPAVPGPAPAAPSPAVAAPAAPVVQGNGGAKKRYNLRKTRTPTRRYAPPPKQQRRERPTAEERLRRWKLRGEHRLTKYGPIPTGRYKTPTGRATLSGVNKQRMAQTRKGDYGGQTLGSLPGYADVGAAVPRAAYPALLGNVDVAGLSERQKMATSVASGLVHASEEHRSPGSGKLERALFEHAVSHPAFNPFDVANNPAAGAGGPQALRDLLGGVTPVPQHLRSAIEDASDSSDEEDEYFPFRGAAPLWKPTS